MPLDVYLRQAREHELESPLNLIVEQALNVDIRFALLVASLLKQVLDERPPLDTLTELFLDHCEFWSIAMVREDPYQLTTSLNALYLSTLPNISAQVEFYIK